MPIPFGPASWQADYSQLQNQELQRQNALLQQDAFRQQAYDVQQTRNALTDYWQQYGDYRRQQGEARAAYEAEPSAEPAATMPEFRPPRNSYEAAALQQVQQGLQQQSALTYNTFSPVLQQIYNGDITNPEAQQALANTFSKDPYLAPLGTILKNATFTKPRTFEVPFDTQNPRSMAALKQWVGPENAWQLDSVPQGSILEISGRQGSADVKQIKPGKESKASLSKVPFAATGSNIDKLLKDADPGSPEAEALTAMKSDLQARPKGAKPLNLNVEYETKPDGSRRIKGITEVAQAGVPTVKVDVGMARRAGDLPPGYFYETRGADAGRIYSKGVDGRKTYLDPEEARQLGQDWTQEKGEARQRAGVKAANVTAAYQMYTTSMPELLGLSKRLRAKQMLPSQLKYANQLSDWAKANASDPDVARFSTQLAFVSDALSAAIGPGQGGKWTFDLASKLLDKNYNYPAFKSVLEGHKKELYTMMKARRSFGKNDFAMPSQSDISAEIERRKQVRGK